MKPVASQCPDHHYEELRKTLREHVFFASKILQGLLPEQATRFGPAVAINWWLSNQCSAQERRSYVRSLREHIITAARCEPFDQAVVAFLREHSSPGGEEQMLVPHALTSSLGLYMSRGWIYVAQLPMMCEATRQLVIKAAFGIDCLPPAGGRHKWKHLDSKTRMALLATCAQPMLLSQMPALAFAITNHQKLHPFADIALIASQHLYPSSYAMFDGLRRLGLDLANAILLGKRTSTDEEVYHRLIMDGWFVPACSLARSPQGVDRIHCVDTLNRMLVDRPDGRLLIMDEGAKLITTLHREPSLRMQAHRVVCIEQTEKGILEIERMQTLGIQLACPVWNVARSHLKKNWEGPIIGMDVVASTWRMLDDVGFQRDMLRPKEAVVLGYWVVGKGVVRTLLSENWQVFVYDQNGARAEDACRDGCIISDGTRPEQLMQDILPHAYLLFGCAACLPGHPALSGDAWEYLPNGSLVVNGASGNYQFNLRTNAEDDQLTCADGNYKTYWRDQSIVLGKIDDPFPHCILVVGSKRLLMAFKGYAVNRIVDIPAPYIGLTRAVMLETSILAVLFPNAPPGLRDVPRELQTRIRQIVDQHLQQRGRSLAMPEFNSFGNVPRRRPSGLPDALALRIRVAVQAEKDWEKHAMTQVTVVEHESARLNADRGVM
jgi:hypothetical protein